jgi:hypothetical protein
MEAATGIEDIDVAMMTDEPSPDPTVADTGGGTERDQVG